MLSGLPREYSHFGAPKRRILKKGESSKKNACDERLSAPTVLVVGALQKALGPASSDPAIASHRWVPWACCDAATAAAARRCAEHYAESATGHRHRRGQHCSRGGRCRRRQNFLPPTPEHWTGRGAAWRRRRGLMRARRAPSCTTCSLFAYKCICAICHMPCAICHVPCAMCAMCHVPCAMCHV